MRDFFKILIVGIVLNIAPFVLAEEYRVLVLPDNIVTETAAVDAYIYNASAEFFSEEVIDILNNTDFISAPSVSEVRASFKSNPSDMLAAKTLTNRFRTTYNIDFVTLKKLAMRSNAQYVLLVTSYIDAENYITRRTLWDFLNIPGATVIDPAYKISTYVVLVDINNNSKLWTDTFYKTISTCENRIITRGPSPQTEQLQKIRDYSRYLSPQIARNVQRNILPADIYEQESTQIDYDLGNIDNVFTKKYRHLKKESGKVYKQKKQDYSLFIDDKKRKIESVVQEKKERNAIRKDAEYEEFKSKLEAETKQNNTEIQEISNVKKQKTEDIKNAIYKKNSTNMLEYSELINIEINKKKKHNLFGELNYDQPDLRDYN